MRIESEPVLMPLNAKELSVTELTKRADTFTRSGWTARPTYVRGSLVFCLVMILRAGNGVPVVVCLTKSFIDRSIAAVV